MKIINFAVSNSIINQYVAELRDIGVQADRNTFRHNLQRIGQMMAYEVSKTLHYSEKTLQTPLAVAKANTPDDSIVLALPSRFLRHLRQCGERIRFGLSLLFR